MLFTMTENPDLLNLHARQQHPQYPEETWSTASGWMKSLARALRENIKQNGGKLFKKVETS
jgi:hypothetical protein